jgi:PAS domain S-box-containing protein
MSVTVILVISILLQFATAFLALRLIRVTGRRTAWVLIAAALFFMAIRRCITLFQAEFLGVPYTTSMPAELVALVISVLMLAGVIWIAPLFLSLKRSEEALRKARDELETRVQERTVSLTETNQRLEREITERKKAEEALRESEEDLNRAQAVAHTGSWRLDVRKNQLLWSDEVYRIFGIPQGTPMTYETFLASVHPEDREYVDREWTAALQGEDYDIEHRIVVGDEIKWVRERAGLEFDRQGMLKGGFGTVQDITQLKQAEKIKDDFIGLVSHELRSPMTVITGAINTALTEAERLSPEETHQLLKDAAAESETLSNLLTNLLELSRVQAQRLVLHSEAINVRKIVQEAVDKIKRQSAAHKFVINLPRRLPPVEADPLRLERILYNLLENAVKYSPSGGEVWVSAKPDGEQLVIGVSDQGIGISRADQAKLFAPFQRLEKRPSGVRGVGLGLMVCRRLVEAHGGRIWVESKPGRGSNFFFTMPLSQGATGDKS